MTIKIDRIISGLVIGKLGIPDVNIGCKPVQFDISIQDQHSSLTLFKLVSKLYKSWSIFIYDVCADVV